MRRGGEEREEDGPRDGGTVGWSAGALNISLFASTGCCGGGREVGDADVRNRCFCSPRLLLVPLRERNCVRYAPSQNERKYGAQGRAQRLKTAMWRIRENARVLSQRSCARGTGTETRKPISWTRPRLYRPDHASFSRAYDRPDGSRYLLRAESDPPYNSHHFGCFCNHTVVICTGLIGLHVVLSWEPNY